MNIIMFDQRCWPLDTNTGVLTSLQNRTTMPPSIPQRSSMLSPICSSSGLVSKEFSVAGKMGTMRSSRFHFSDTFWSAVAASSSTPH